MWPGDAQALKKSGGSMEGTMAPLEAKVAEQEDELNLMMVKMEEAIETLDTKDAEALALKAELAALEQGMADQMIKVLMALHLSGK